VLVSFSPPAPRELEFFQSPLGVRMTTKLAKWTGRHVGCYVFLCVLFASFATPVLADCDVSPQVLDFGSVPVGESRLLSFTFKNTGIDTLRGAISETCDTFRILPPVNYDLAPEESREVEVEFFPTSATGSACTIDIGHSDCPSVFAIGLGMNPAGCEVSPSSGLDFGSVVVDSSLALDLTLTNVGQDVLSGEVTLNCTEFRVDGEANYSLGPDQSQVFSIVYQPIDEGDDFCVIDTGSELCGDVSATGSGILLPDCQADATPADFGNVLIGETIDGEIRLENIGGGTLQGSFLTDCDGFSLVDTDGQYELGPGESIVFTTRFAPTEIREYSCIARSENCEVPLNGRGIGSAVCDVSPDSLDFGDVEAGASRDLSFTILNSGTASMSGTVTERCGPFTIVGEATYFLGVGDSQEFTVRFAPEASGTQVCSLDLGSPLCSSFQAEGTGTLLPECRVSSPDLEFGATAVGSSSTRTLAIENVGGGRLEGAVRVVCDEFELEGNGSYDLGARQSQVFTIIYSPVDEGADTCTIDTGTRCAAVPAFGFGTIDPICTVEPSGLDFGSTAVGESVFRNLTIRNDGGGEISGEFVSDCSEFSFVGSSSFSVAADQTEELLIRFSSSGPGTYSCNLTSTDEGCSSVLAMGEVVAPPVCDVSPLYLDFGSVVLGESVDGEVTVTNRGGSVLTGTLSADCDLFAVIDVDPSYVLGPNSFKTFTLRYTALIEGVSTCVLEVGDDCTDVQLTGSGNGPPEPVCEVSRTEIRFEPVQIGESISARFELENVGEGVLTGSVSLDCAAFSFQGDPSYALAAGEAREFEIRFEPVAIGATECEVEFSGGCSPILLFGEGTDVRNCSVLPDFFDFGAVDIGSQVEENFVIRNSGEGTLSGIVSIAGACPDVFIVGPSSYSLLPGEDQAFRVRFEPSTQGSRTCLIETGSHTCFDIPFAATGVLPPFCEVSTRFLNLGKVEVGSSRDGTFRMVNTGGGLLEGEMSLACEEWSLLGSSLYELSSGEARDFTVRFSPGVEGPANCEIELGSERCGTITAIGTAEPVPAPICSFSPQFLDFGAAQIGTQSLRTVTLENTGNADLNGTLVTDCVQFRVIGNAEVDLAPGEAHTVELRFDPTAIGPIECELLLDGCEDRGVSLRGRGEAASPPLCSLSTTDLDFGVAPLGQSPERELIIRNDGGGRLEGSIQVGCSDFELLGSDVYSLGPDEWYSAILRFRPIDGTEVSCLLDIGQDGCGPIALRGRGTSSLEAICSVTPEVVDFGELELDAFVVREVLIENSGEGTLLGEIGIDGSEISVLGEKEFFLRAGESQTFTLRWDPTLSGGLESQAHFSDACPIVTLSGVALEESSPLCRTEPILLDFGLVPTGERRVLPLTIFNDGGGVLSGQIDLDCSDYSVIGSGDYSLRRGESVTKEIEYVGGLDAPALNCQLRVAECVIEAQAATVRTDLELAVESGAIRPFGFGVQVGDVSELLGSLGRLGTDYDLWRWSDEDLSYLRWSELSAPVATDILTGDGFWLESKADDTLEWSGVPVLDTVVRYPLTSGWTQFSSLYQVPIAVSKLGLDDGTGSVPLLSAANSFTAPVVWAWTGFEYVPATELRPFESYWIRLRAGAPIVDLVLDRSADNQDFEPARPDWNLQIAARQGEANSVHASLGAATDQALSRRAVPAPPFATLQMHVADESGGISNPEKSSDLYRSFYLPESEVMVFDLTVAGLDPDEPLTLEFAGENIPSGANFVLTHWEQRLTRAVSPNGVVRLDPLGEEFEFRMVVSFVGPDSIPPESLPPDIALSQFPIAQPNPFFSETELRLILFQPGDLTIEIYDPHGRRVRSIYRSGLSAGEISVLWDGTDDHGDRVQSGVYLARFVTGGTTRTMRVVRVG